MYQKKAVRVLCTVLCGIMSLSTLTSFAGCTGKKKDSVVIMTEELSGLFNPFYATSGTDMDVVGMTQIGMLSTDNDGMPVAGDDLATVVKDFEYNIEGSGETAKTVYKFVLKNGLKFSDGHPLTMNDVIFNMYEYLDPVYTGSSTMYSIDIEGLSQYRTQQNLSDNDGTEDLISSTAAGYAQMRVQELITVFEDNALIEGSQNSYNASESEMKTYIQNHAVSQDYKNAVASLNEQDELEETYYQEKLWADYQLTLKTFKEELEADYKAAKESFDLTTAPYSDWKKELSNDIFKFFLYEGYITPEYADDVENPGRKDKTKIVKFNNPDIVKSYDTEAKAVERVYNDKIGSELNQILSYWGTAGTLTTLYTAEAIDVQLRNNVNEDGSLAIPNIKGIVSLGHTDNAPESVTVNGNVYNVATTHDEYGAPTNAGEYDVLQITVNGTDPKAIYNFGFTVAPAHYYTADSDYPNGRTIDIKNNKFGVEFADSSFQSYTIQSQEHLEVPVGAGVFKATNKNNADNPKGSEFWSENIVYFKANEHFMFEVKAEKFRMQVVSSSNAIDKLKSGEVDYITPQFTKANSQALTALEKKGFKQLDSWQLGYGYIGINAGKVPNVYVRRAIMASMQASLALEYYEPGTCKIIDWPMSTVSWAYPFEDDGKTSKPNGHSYTQWTDTTGSNYADAKAEIQELMNLAGVTEGDSSLKIRFTIAGASITEHPTYAVFKQSAELLNSMGWDVEVKADSQALTKLATGSLEVWAAAWGSTIDPDMYQVYHKNSSATSVYAWGYREIKSNQTTYSYEMGIINELSDIIDQARSMMDSKDRTPLYEQAMSLVLDLAVEMPVYQRKTLYAYNTKTITGLTTEVNHYSSPLEKLWEVELIESAGAAGDAEGGMPGYLIAIIVIGGVLVLAVGGYFGYKFLGKKKKVSVKPEYEAAPVEEAQDVAQPVEETEETTETASEATEETSETTEKDSE